MSTGQFRRHSSSVEVPFWHVTLVCVKLRKLTSIFTETRSYSWARLGLTLIILLTQPLECHDYRHEPLFQHSLALVARRTIVIFLLFLSKNLLGLFFIMYETKNMFFPILFKTFFAILNCILRMSIVIAYLWKAVQSYRDLNPSVTMHIFSQV